MRRLSILFILYALLIRNSIETDNGVPSAGETPPSTPPSGGTGDDSTGKEKAESLSPAPGPSPADSSSKESDDSIPSAEDAGLKKSSSSDNGPKGTEEDSKEAGETEKKVSESDKPKEGEPASDKTQQDSTKQDASQSSVDGQNPQTKGETGSKGPVQPPTESDSTPVATPAEFLENFNLKSAMLKNYKGLKITGECNADLSIFFVPYILIDVNTKTNQIFIMSTKKKVRGTTKGVATPSIDFKSEGDTLQNVCGENKTFKIVVYFDGDVLYVKWKVYDPSVQTEPNTNVDVRKYRLKNFETPITSIQVHSIKGGSKTVTFETKNYTINDHLPEKCDEIASDCFLHGHAEIEKCYKCALLYQKTPLTDECYNYVPRDYKESLKADLARAQSDDEINYEVMEHIENILDGIYNVNDNNKELKTFEELSDETKKDILLYCKELKESDVTGTLEDYASGDAEDVYANLTKLITNNMEDSISKLKSKLMNPAICLKDVNQWGEKKTGLVLPELSSNNVDNSNENDDTKTDLESDEKLKDEGFDGVIDLPLPHENEFAGYTTIEDFQYCNNEYCDRLKDKNSCISKLNVEEQGNCATSWLFASKLHLDTIGCMKGHENFSASALYVANCSKTDSKDKCLTGSNPLEFLNIIDENKFLPTTSNLPYSYKKVGEECPQTMENWTNLWKDVKLLKSENNDKSLNANGYISYQSEHFKENFNEYVNLIKQEIQNKGSVIAYVNSKDINSYDFNGNKVHKLCGSATPDLAVNIIGYGNYANENNEVKSYWLVRNSWGKHWADEGNFKVDIETPENCEHNFIHTFATFNIYVPFVKKNTQTESEINLYYSKNSPDFYNNLYLKNLDADNTNEDSLIQGQDEPAKDLTSQDIKQPTEDVDPKSSQGTDSKEKSKSDEEKKAKAKGEAGSETLPTGTEVKGQEQVQEQVQEQAQGDTEKPAEEKVQKTEGEHVEKQKQTNPDGTEVTDNPAGKEGKKAGTTEEGSSKTQEDSPPTKPEGPQENQPQPGQPQVVQPQAPGQPASGAKARLPAGPKLEFMHVLKQIKNGKVKMNLVKYGNELNLIDERACSRVYAVNPEKKTECEEFCVKNWNECKDTEVPGYCLAHMYNSNNCYFCFV
uniref:Putative papain-like cysteine prorease n=1 Tax=Plasmodium chabaudi chabaudi TaxID=31271 RepID=A0A0E4B3R8_PLACU|nr:putative papain-like cysteine prorease [Plasmodium chabaudi chabaudi]